MSFNSLNVDLLLQYVLLIAGEEDDLFDRQLGPIHLIKYVYLADLSYAKTNNGKTFTGADWKFYNYGPWSRLVYERIEPALVSINADKKTMPSDYEGKDDWVRWYIRDDNLLTDRENQLPAKITMHLRYDIHKYGKDTPSLLDFVYKTKPMLYAAPNEYLDFSLVAGDLLKDKTESNSLRMDNLSNRKKKKFKEKIQALQKIHKNRINKEDNLINPVKNPRYDEIYIKGIEWLDDIAGKKLTFGEKIAEFSEEVWKSNTRKGEDVP